MPEFHRRYREELTIQTDLRTQLQAHAEAHPATLLLAARDRERNSAVPPPGRLDECPGRDGETGA